MRHFIVRLPFSHARQEMRDLQEAFARYDAKGLGDITPMEAGSALLWCRRRTTHRAMNAEMFPKVGRNLFKIVLLSLKDIS